MRHAALLGVIAMTMFKFLNATTLALAVAGAAPAFVAMSFVAVPQAAAYNNNENGPVGEDQSGSENSGNHQGPGSSLAGEGNGGGASQRLGVSTVKFNTSFSGACNNLCRSQARIANR